MQSLRPKRKDFRRENRKFGEACFVRNKRKHRSRVGRDPRDPDWSEARFGRTKLTPQTLPYMWGGSIVVSEHGGKWVGGQSGS